MSRIKLRTIAMISVIAGSAMTGIYHYADAQQTAGNAPSSIVETYQDWIVRCVNSPAAPSERVCEITQEMDQRETGQRVLAVSVTTDSDGANLTVIAPFGLDLAQGLSVRVGDSFLLGMDFETCLPAGCIALDNLSFDQVDLLRNDEAASMSMSMLNIEANELILDVSLSGFASAWERLNQLSS